MSATIRGYALGAILLAGSGGASAGPISVIGDSGFSGEQVTVGLRDQLTSALDSATLLIGFNPLHLRYLSSTVPAVQSPAPPSPALNGLLPQGTVVGQGLVQLDATLSPPDNYVISDLLGPFPDVATPLGPLQFIGVIVAISSNGIASDQQDGLILGVNFEILNAAPIGDSTVSFRCIPPFDASGATPSLPPDTVTENTPDAALAELCLDYAIPFRTGNVNVLAPASNGQAPIASTASLALLGLGLMAWMRGRCVSPTESP